MKERTFVAGVVAFLIIGSLLAMASTDGVYIAVSVLFFIICIGYAEWCERL